MKWRAGSAFGSNTSASNMLQRLAELGYLKYDSCESLLPTDRGRETGDYLPERHDTVERFLTMIGNGDPLEEAGLIEHSISPPTVSEINTLTAFVARNPDIREKYEAFKRTEAGIGEKNFSEGPHGP